MQLLGYGEDALSFWALSRRLEELLLALDDEPGAGTTVFYRPSFGRRAAALGQPMGVRGPQFGELGAIVATERGVYLIEARSSDSPEIVEGTIELRPEQIRRHQIFWRYLEAWVEAGEPSWEEFVAGTPAFPMAGAGGMERFRVAPAGSALARTLEGVLRRCARAGAVRRDVVLVVRPEEEEQPADRRLVGPEGFEVVEIECGEVEDGFVGLGPAQTAPLSELGERLLALTAGRAARHWSRGWARDQGR